MRNLFFACSLLLVVTACNEYTPRPLAYPRIERGKSDTVQYSNPRFLFSYPNNVDIIQKPADRQGEIWLNIRYPQFHATVHCTYLPIVRRQLADVLDDNHRLAYSHAAKADGINQTVYSDTNEHKYGIFYDIEGHVAVPVQFFVTDSIANFYRGSLYYDDKVNADSIAPVTDIIRQDIIYMIETLEWRNK